MKHLFKLCLTTIILLGAMKYSLAQHASQPVPLGGTETFLQNVRGQLSSSVQQKKSAKTFISQKISSTENISLQVNFQKSENDEHHYLVGEVEDHESSNFFIKVNGNTLDGNIILKKEKKAYKYYSDKQGNAYIQEVDIHSLLCVEYDEAANAATSNASATGTVAEIPTNLQSLPGANGCVLLDFDGQYVSGTPWNGGNPINAAPSGMSDADIQELWEVVSEDFRPFNVNITTSETVFNTYPRTRRMRCIITPTNTAAPGAGGVAYIGSFNWDDDTPCWVFITSGKAGGEASSHEVGHTFGLGHDGRNSPSEGYYAGQGDWAPIMGVGYYKNITQWSKGEYNSANNTEDDLAKISSATYGVGYRADDHGGNTGSATSLIYDANGSVAASQNKGIIERTSDVDYFSFSTSGGTISLAVNTVSRHGDLDILVRLYNSSGAQIGVFNPAGLNASVNANLGAGQYYLSIDGTGAGNPATDGYSDYASLGSYFISGSIPPASVQGAAVVYKDCNYGGYAAGLNVGDYTLAQLNAKGILNNDISSIKVDAGYNIQLFENDNFSGASITLNANNSCLVADGWNDRVSSLKVRTTGVATVYQDCNYGGYSSRLPVGDYTLSQLNAKGIQNDDISSLKVNSGYELQLFQDDNFQGASITITSDNSCLVSNGWNDQVSSIKVRTETPTFSDLIQAENYSAMAGVQTETTTDAGGGLNVGWIDAGDWMAYNSINFPTSGTYTIEYRVASLSGGGILSADLNAGSIVLGSVNIPSTGGWQNWTTVSHAVNINAGTYNFGIYAQAGGWNINWIRISKQGTSAAIAQVNTTASSSLEVYPNPVKGELNLKSAQDFSNADVRIIHFDGREVFRGSSSDLTINVSSLNSGMYTIIVSKDGVQSMTRFVKE